MTDFVYVENLGEINRAINLSGPLYAKAMHKGLLQAADPVKRDADRLSMSEFSGMKRAKKSPPPWSIQRKGQTIHEVYVAPTQRGKIIKFGDPGYSSERSRKFRERMMGKAYEPAFEQNRTTVVRVVENWLGTVTREI